MALNVFFILVAYVLGSIPSAVWIGKRFYGIDVREHGSRNAGATNTLRVLGARAALPVFAIDILKGFAAVMLAHLSGYEAGSSQMFNLKIALVAAAVAGHILPLFADFRGGKGVATLAGAVLAVYPGAVLLCLLVFAVVFGLTHYVSLGSMSAGVAFPIFILILKRQPPVSLVVFGCVIALLLLFTHRKNIRRLLTRSESKTYLFRHKG